MASRTMSQQPRILIAGGGIGGLALAHALRRGGLHEVAVYEKESAPATRNQGFRIHVDAEGNAALRACLPTRVLDLVRSTSGVSNDLLATYTDQLQQLMAQSFPIDSDDVITHVDRHAFRQALLTDLREDVHFGRTVTGCQVTGSGRVRVQFAQGGSDEGDVLVGADGIGSAVRRRLLPHATVRDLGLRCVYGRMPITSATEQLIPLDFNRGFCWVADERGCGVGFAPMRFRDPTQGTAEGGCSDGAGEHGDLAYGDYLMTALVATRERLDVPDEWLFALSPRELWQLAVDATSQWHPALKEILRDADADSFFPVAVRAGERVDAWQSGPITLLGDAVHTMPPTGGIGANTALQDAATLADELLCAARGEKPLIDAVADYERVMLPRGFDNIDYSLRNAGMMFGAQGAVEVAGH
jgi:2-polyprenyl-6-methoxyphenol hydroxylase-like FAD-dependent oxidoreductase